MVRSPRIFAYFFFLSLMLLSFMLRAQSLTQTVRGKVTDQDSRTPLPGVNVVVTGAGVFLGGSTDGQVLVLHDLLAIHHITMLVDTG